MSTPILFGKTPSTQDVVSQHIKELFSSVELHLVRTDLSKLHIAGTFYKIQPFYSSFRMNLPAFMKAYQVKKDVSLHDHGFSVNVDYNSVYPGGLPDVLFKLLGVKNGNPSDTIHNRLMELGCQKSVFDRETYYRIPIKTIEVARELLEFDTDESGKLFTVSNVTNVSGLLSFIVLKKMFSLFLLTNRYPGFHDGNPTDDETWRVHFPELKNKRKQKETTTKRKRARVEQEGESDEAMEPSDEEGEEDEEDNDIDLTTKDPDSILRAKAPSSTNPNPWGSRDKVPDNKGLFFAFVLQLANPDHNLVLNLVRTYFIRFLGADEKEILSEYTVLSRSWHRLKGTDAAKELAHLAAGIQLSLETQTVVYPIFEGGEYLGFVLSGDEFAVMVDGVRYKPVARQQIHEAIEKVSTHSNAIKEILDIIYTESTVIGDYERLLPDDITSFRQIWGQIRIHNLAESTMVQIERLIPKLRFRTVAWGNTLDHITTAFKAVKEFSEPDHSRRTIAPGSLSGLPEHTPMAPSAFRARDKWTCVLSVFGDFAPSPNVPRGVKQNLTKATEWLDPMSKCTLAFYDRPLAEAVKDWEEFEASGFIVNNPKEKVVASKYRSYAQAQRVEIVELMRSLIVVQGEKRVAGARTEVAVASGSALRRKI